MQVLCAIGSVEAILDIVKQLLELFGQRVRRVVDDMRSYGMAQFVKQHMLVHTSNRIEVDRVRVGVEVARNRPAIWISQVILDNNFSVCH